MGQDAGKEFVAFSKDTDHLKAFGMQAAHFDNVSDGVHQPVFDDAILGIPLRLLGPVPGRACWREDLHHQMRSPFDPGLNDRPAFVAHEDHIGLKHQGSFTIQDDVERCDKDRPKAGLLTRSSR